MKYTNIFKSKPSSIKDILVNYNYYYKYTYTCYKIYCQKMMFLNYVLHFFNPTCYHGDLKRFIIIIKQL